MITYLKHRWFIFHLILAQAIFISIAFSQTQEGYSKELNEIHQWIVKEHPSISHINGSNLESQLQMVDNLLIFDVREIDEFSVSHLDNAIRVDPSISAAEFATLYGHQLQNKKIVFYCSVGRRSSLLAERVEKEAITLGASKILNLENGIFGWHNQKRPLTSVIAPTNYVHPYNQKWGKLIQQKELIRYDVD
jgi:rhodanese-related sulfurtransferase